MALGEAGDVRVRPQRHIVRWVILLIVVLLVACVVWVGVRGVLAKNHLEKAVALATQVQSDVTSGDAKAAQASAAELAAQTSDARRLTADPIWRGAEVVPLVGPNLTAVREVSGILADVSTDAIEPIAGVLGTVNVAQFKPVDGAVDLEPLVKAQPTIASATASLQTNLERARDVDTTGTVGQVDTAVDQLASVLAKASSAAETADRAVTLLPDMMGQSEPKKYLLLFQNNAELRSTGGVPSAVALMTAEKGRLALQKQASSADFPELAKPVIDLPLETEGIYGSITGRFLQDVNLTPRFPLTGEIAQQLWKKRYGATVDGVISIDPVALGYLLTATGDVTLPNGDILTSSNVVTSLLSDSYAKYPDPAVQDTYFKAAAGAIFAKVASGDFDPKLMLTALTRAGDEGRILVWSDDKAQQKTISKTALSGELPRGSKTRPAFGIYLNDSTGAKMDYYLSTQVSIGQVTCRKDGRPNYVVDVTLTNNAPADASTSLPEYVTGGGVFGVAPGNVQTTVSIYAPKTGVFTGVIQDGKTRSLHTATDSGYPVSQFETLVKPGKSTTWRLQYIGPKNATVIPSLTQTPGVNVLETKQILITCNSLVS